MNLMSMRRLGLFCVTVFVSSTFNSQQVRADAEFVGWCKAIRSTAFLAMSGRQFDNNISKTINEVGVSEASPESVNRMKLEIVQEAYKSPIRLSDDSKLDSISEFSERLYDNCIYWLDDGTSSNVGRGSLN